MLRPGSLVSARVLLAHSVAHIPGAPLTDSIWYDPAFLERNQTFEAKPGIVLTSSIGKDGQMVVTLACLKLLPFYPPSATVGSGKDISFHSYVYPRVETFVVVPSESKSVRVPHQLLNPSTDCPVLGLRIAYEWYTARRRRSAC